MTPYKSSISGRQRLSDVKMGIGSPIWDKLQLKNIQSLMVCCCISVYDVGSLHIWNCTINAEEHIEVLEQHIIHNPSFSGKALHISARQGETTYCIHHNSTVLQEKSPVVSYSNLACTKKFYTSFSTVNCEMNWECFCIFLGVLAVRDTWRRCSEVPNIRNRFL